MNNKIGALYKPLKSNQQGLSLIELMVAVLLGLILTAAVLQIFQSISLTFKHNDQLARIQENGRFSLALLSRDIHMAGYRNPDKGELLNYFYADETNGCKATDKFCTNDGGLNQNDRIAVQLEAINETDCTGHKVASDKVVVNVYYLEELDNISTLHCRGFDPDTKTWLSDPAPLIAGIDAFQILYGIAGDDGYVTQYINANRVNDWLKVRAVKIGMLVNSGEDNGFAGVKERSYSILDSGELIFKDNKVRYIYSTTFTINNASLDMIGSI
ncbi:PilW family protein [Endozoicomonas sp. SM1973]|uniref:PilW family protein n=1 Tax=Spartinivicinus marinus TaxID=2994442 RepID=A0A853HTE2_9GAMM|nr:PilW family protein [Spartinivicinus marinus]MCX4026719.1 PilW family protein [Spartinivicinus marinus]NYZ64553.1 PilW family protein [Spartinivicinus marinus]